MWAQEWPQFIENDPFLDELTKTTDDAGNASNRVAVAAGVEPLWRLLNFCLAMRLSKFYQYSDANEYAVVVYDENTMDALFKTPKELSQGGSASSTGPFDYLKQIGFAAPQFSCTGERVPARVCSSVLPARGCFSLLPARSTRQERGADRIK